jgi:hypothetical protein
LTNWSGESQNWSINMNLKRRLEKLEGASEGGPPYHIVIHGKTYESDISMAKIIRTVPSSRLPPSERKKVQHEPE